MPVKKQIPFSCGHFFITFTCYKWLPLIDITNGYDLLYNWFDILKAKGHFITGYVIMPNHVHTTIAFRESKKRINSIIGDGKRFMSYGIVKRLTAIGQIALLQQLQDGVNSSDKKRGKLHEVWEDSFDWKECRSYDFLNQKLDYMHNNPCNGKWNLAVNPYSYLHSSGKFYITGERGIYPVTNFMELADLDLGSSTEWRRVPRLCTKARRGDSPGNLKFKRETRSGMKNILIWSTKFDFSIMGAKVCKI